MAARARDDGFPTLKITTCATEVKAVIHSQQILTECWIIDEKICTKDMLISDLSSQNALPMGDIKNC